MVRLRRQEHPHFAARIRCVPAVAALCAIVVAGVLGTPVVAAAERTVHFHSGFGEYYVDVLYRGGKYAEAAALAKNLLDEEWSTKDPACADTLNRAHLVLQIARRLGHFQPAAGLLGAQVHAVRYWVRGRDPVAPPALAQATPESVAVPNGAGHNTRVMGWQVANLGFTEPVPLAATAPIESAAPVPVPLLRETSFIHAVQPSKTYEPPRPRTVDIVSESDDDSPRPAPVKTKPRKVKPAARTATASTPQPSAPPPRLEEWMEKAFVN